MKIHYYNGVWVAGDGSNQTGFYFSTDGKSWSPAACSEKYVQVNEIFGSSGIYVAGISRGASYSIDGKTWYIVPFKDVPFIYNANGIWVAGTGSGLYYSPTWEVSTPPRAVSEEWVLKSSVTASPLTIPGESGFLTLPLEADFSSGLTAYDKFVLVEDGSSSLSLGGYFTI
nr:MAG TPA: Photosynthesis system II assembly factor YCF48 [Caudoviricetes sp.]